MQLLIQMHTVILLLLKIAIFSNCALFFSHIQLNNTSYGFAVLLYILSMYITYLRVSTQITCNPVDIRGYTLQIIILKLLVLLWCATTLFSVIYILDCLNICILLQLVDGSNVRQLNDLDYRLGYRLQGVILHFWFSFLATVLLLLSGLLIINNLTTANFDLILIYINFMNHDHTFGQLGLTFAIVSLLAGFTLKLGLGPLVLWKRLVLTGTTFHVQVLYIYMYYNVVFLYYILNVLNLFPIQVVSLYIYILLLTTVIIVYINIQTATTISSFLVLSSLLSTTLQLITFASICVL